MHEWLHQHPNVFMSRMKEPQYFAPHRTRWGQAWGQGNPFPEPGMDWYLRLFAEAGDAAYAGESSVSYSARPWVEDCHQRIYDFNPNARIIYLMRDPIERTISHYWHFVADGREDRALSKAVRRSEDYVARSDYALQLRPYLETFGEEQVYALTLEELNADPESTFRRLFAWLGVDPSVTICVNERHNVGAGSLRIPRRGFVPVDTLLKDWRWLRVRGLLPGVENLLRATAYRTLRRAEIDVYETESYLRSIFRPKIESLENLLGRSFSDWPTVSEQGINVANNPLKKRRFLSSFFSNGPSAVVGCSIAWAVEGTPLKIEASPAYVRGSEALTWEYVVRPEVEIIAQVNKPLEHHVAFADLGQVPKASFSIIKASSASGQAFPDGKPIMASQPTTQAAWGDSLPRCFGAQPTSAKPEKSDQKLDSEQRLPTLTGFPLTRSEEPLL